MQKQSAFFTTTLALTCLSAAAAFVPASASAATSRVAQQAGRFASPSATPAQADQQRIMLVGGDTVPRRPLNPQPLPPFGRG